MSELRANGIAFVVMLASFPFIAFGSNEDLPVVWALGVALLGLALVVPTANRYVSYDEEDGE